LNEGGEEIPSPSSKMIDEDSLIFGSLCNVKSIFFSQSIPALCPYRSRYKERLAE
jgi:hypothetical protein